MSAANEPSFYQTILNAAAFLFDGGTYTTAERNDLTKWILSHQNRHKDFIFYPTKEDRENGIHFFSGEKPRTKFLADNLVELETLRVLALINPRAPEVREIFKRANKRIFPQCFANKCSLGECAHASIAFMRYLIAYDIEFYTPRVISTIEILKKKRDGKGRWEGFPFFFTLLWLTELPENLAADELVYASDACLRLISRNGKAFDRISLIRGKILHQALTIAAKNQTAEVKPRQRRKNLVQPWL